MRKCLAAVCVTLISIFCFLGAQCEGESETGSAEAFSIDDLKNIVKELPDAETSFNMTAAEFVAGMRIGWNLGNTLDATPGGETSWVRHITNQSNIDTLKSVGFNVIRIPVSWCKPPAMNMSTYQINEAWLNRVEEIVNYALRNNLYVILNSHHDENVFKFTEEEKAESLAAFRIIWTQIANRFKDYNEKLIFEALNEPRTKGSAREWQGGTPAEHAVLNEYYQVFVDLIRASGGNNNRRFLLINPYAASAESAAVNGLVLPRDSAANKIIVSIHAYAPYNFALNTSNAYNTWDPRNHSDRGGIDRVFVPAYEKFISRSIPVIMGEFGAMNKNNDDARREWAFYFVSEARKLGIPCILWDNGNFSGSGERFALINRSNNTFPNPKYLEGLMRGAGIINN